LYSLNIIGTTFSGHPTRTTLGNSLRVLFYILFLLKVKIGLDWSDVMTILRNEHKDISVYVAGDDVMIFGLRTLITALEKHLRYVYAPDVLQGCYGLGQCARETAMNDFHFVDFLSRDGYYHNSLFKVVRKLDRLINDGNMS
jgi:hypothetical protein